MYLEIEQNSECLELCKFRSKKVMEMVNTALESLDLIVFKNKSLGTIGVPYVVVIFHL